MEYTKLMSVLDDCLKEEIPIYIFWEDGCVFQSDSNTGVFETDNGYETEPEDANFREFYACAVSVSKLIKSPQNPSPGSICENIQIGDLVEVSAFDEPLKIETLEGKLLWSKGDA